MESLLTVNSPLAFCTPALASAVFFGSSEDWQDMETKWRALINAGDYLERVGLHLIPCKDGGLLTSKVPYCKDIPWDIYPIFSDERTWSEKWEDFWSDASLMQMLVSSYLTQHKLTARDFLLAYASINMYDRGQRMLSYKATASKLSLLSTYIEATGTYLPPDLDGLSADQVFSRVKNKKMITDLKPDGTWPYRVSPATISQSQQNLCAILDSLSVHCQRNFQDETGYKILPVGNTFRLAKGDLASIMEGSNV